jgi:toxin ParE1/3/4
VKAVWTSEAAADLDNLVRHVAQDNLAAALRAEDRLIAAVERLQRFPASGRVGRWGATRELVVTHSPYVVIYRVRSGAVEVLRILHGAQEWPPK